MLAVLTHLVVVAMRWGFVLTLLGYLLGAQCAGLPSMLSRRLPLCGLLVRLCLSQNGDREACVSKACSPDNGTDAERRPLLPNVHWEQHKPFRASPREPRADETSQLVLGAGLTLLWGPKCTRSMSERGRILPHVLVSLKVGKAEVMLSAHLHLGLHTES